NHPAELTGLSGIVLERLAEAGITLLNQSVLLKGVNDSLSVQLSLAHALFHKRVVPYYLHQLDRVAGTSHFETPLERGKSLYKEMRKSLPGYLLPRYVQEIPGRASKTVVC
ncbi:MAG: EF-P beta-lysylation protein EpmB, partial [Fibrobacteria bacterium]|nr:EF-P beta-lysylation protein EpmB [Fibrobacteria bacterium]